MLSAVQRYRRRGALPLNGIRLSVSSLIDSSTAQAQSQPALPRDLSFAGFADRPYPFKPPLHRIRVGGKWMSNPATAPGGAFSRQRPPTPPPKASPHTQPWLRIPLPKHSGHDTAIVQTGRRLPRPNLRTIARVRSSQPPGATAEDKPVVVKQDIWEEDALSHNSGLQLLFLGTGTGHPAEQRRTGCMALKVSKGTWLFDCGEDTQRQVHKQPLIRHGRMDRIFITNRRSMNTLGLPGMLCTMSASRAIGLDLTDVPLHVYGPPGLAEFIGPLLRLSDTFISMPIIVHEFVDHAVDVRQMEQPTCLDRRSCLYRVLLPPDKLNPKGYYNGEIVPFLTRATARTNAMAKGLDERSIVRELKLPPTGDPSAAIEGPQDLRWTVRCDRDASITAAAVTADVDTWAYVFQETDRTGKLFVDRCTELHVEEGSAFSRLKEGQSVRNRHGQIVHPHQVVGPDIPGRKLVVVGESCDSRPIADLAHDADAIVHSASCQVAQADGLAATESTIEMASAFGKAVDAKHMVLYRFKPGEQLPQAGAASLGPEASGADAGAVGCLNTVGKLTWERRAAHGGYLGRSRDYWKPEESPPEVVRAAEQVAAAVFGKDHRVTVAEDMDLYAVSRRLATGPSQAAAEEEQEAEQQKAAVAP